MIADVTCRSR